MVNLVIKMLLEDKEFSKKLQNAKGELKGIDALGGAAFKGIAGAVTRVAGAVGVAMGGMEAFNKLMASSQTLADSWGATMEAAKTSVDNFFYSLGSGDFSPFLGGLDDMINRAREAYALLDDFGNVQMSYNYKSAEVMAEYQKQLNVARDTTLSREERAAGLANAQKLQAEMQKMAAEYNRSAMETIAAGLASRGGFDKSLVTREMIDKALSLDISSDRAKMREDMSGQYAAYQAELNALRKANTSTLTTPYGGTVESVVETPEYLAQVAALQKRYADVIVMYAALEIYSDEALKEAGQLITATSNAIRQIESQERALQRAAASINNVGGTTRTPTVRTRGEEGAFVFGDTGVGGSLASAFAGAEDFQRRQRASQAEAERRALEQSGLAAQIEGLPAHMTNIAIPEDTIDKLRETTSAVQQLGGAFGQLGNAIGGNAGALVSWVGSLMEASAGMALTIAMLNAESQAHITNATAATADAGAKVMAAHAGIPFAGIAIGAAAVATMVATLLSLPKFAKGGIATGPTIGLFGEAGTEAIIPLDRLDSMLSSNARPVRVVGELRARGKDLVGTISNYEKVQAVR
jgi:hypothetical protein